MGNNLYFLSVLFLAVLPIGFLSAQDGTLDSGFGTGGIVATSFATGSVDASNDITLQSDGKIIAVGSSIDPNSGVELFSLSRYLPNGSLDNSFGTSGKVITDAVPGYMSAASAVELQADGKIIVAGYANDTNTTATQNGYVVAARYKTNGTLDSTFGTNGIAAYQVPAVFDPQVTVTDMLIQPDSEIVISGGAFVNWVDGDMVFMRLDVSGSPDLTFGNSGMSIQAPQFGGYFPMAINRLMDGRIAVAGLIDAGTHNDPFLTAIGAGGLIDLGFGTGGFVNPTYGSSSGFLGIAVQADDKIVACGFGFAGAVIARFYNDGTTDAAFGTAGSVIIPIGTSQDAAFEDVEIQSDGKIIAAGGADAKFAMVRTSDLGVLDAGFGSGGIVQTTIGSGIDDMANAVSLQSDGKIVLGGFSYSTSPSAPGKYALARYNNTVTGSGDIEMPEAVIQIFPNPASDFFTVLTSEVEANTEISVFNTMGELVLSVPSSGSATKINSELLPAGIYSVVVTGCDFMSTQTLLISGQSEQ